MKKILFSALPFLLQLQLSYGQDTLNSIVVSINKGGTIYSTYPNALQGNFQGIDVGYRINMSNDRADWVRMLHIKYLSLEARVSNNQNVSVAGLSNSKGFLGVSYSAVASLGIPMFALGNVSFVVSPGIGLSYYPITFGSSTTAPPIVGSHGNAEVKVDFLVDFPVSHFTSIQLGWGWYHDSNGGMTPGNCGVNRLPLSVGIVQAIGSSGPRAVRSSFVASPGFSFEASIDYGTHGLIGTNLVLNPHLGENNFFQSDSGARKNNAELSHFGFHGRAAYQLNSIFSFKAGLDMITYGQVFSWNNVYGTYEGKTFTSYASYTLGGAVGFELMLGRLSFNAMYGRYLYSKFLNSVSSYEIGGVGYRVTPWMQFNVNVNFQQALQSQYVSSGLTFSIR